LQEMLDIPVFHDDQHGTAIVTAAALLNALKVVGKRLEDLRVVISGVGAAGMACAKMLLALGVGEIIACDREGALYPGRPGNLNPAKAWLAERTNRARRAGTLAEVLPGADLFLGVSGPGILTPAMVRTMARDPIIFALSNPIPEILPEDAAAVAAVMATGRSDYPNQINNALAFPGVFRGALDVQARAINEPMKLAAVRAIAQLVPDAALRPDYIVPSIFDRHVVPAVSAAVAQAAQQTGVARRRAPTPIPGAAASNILPQPARSSGT
ncbi:MAG: NAD-dependent malic enzyme, partial [Chloroflexi bacterium]|nr:NAD-dependent malic enzyme [Chloroflexota bacterium]